MVAHAHHSVAPGSDPTERCGTDVDCSRSFTSRVLQIFGLLCRASTTGSTEGFDMADLKMRKVLLAELSD